MRALAFQWPDTYLTQTDLFESGPLALDPITILSCTLMKISVFNITHSSSLTSTRMMYTAASFILCRFPCVVAKPIRVTSLVVSTADWLAFLKKNLLPECDMFIGPTLYLRALVIKVLRDVNKCAKTSVGSN